MQDKHEFDDEDNARRNAGRYDTPAFKAGINRMIKYRKQQKEAKQNVI